ncbi:MAG: acetyl-CoA carboxylase carboxyltransferase subunit beta [Acidobacteria bacterium]|nr:acetyl-CoA carboxylase carboxyltransferase subunit beta [Acidobacteriota bacterium]
MTWFRREKQRLQLPESTHIRTEGLWIKCEGCRQIIWKKDLEANWNVCPKCEYHFRLDARERLRLLLDEGKYTEHDAGLETTNPLDFVDLKPYPDRVRSAQQATGLKDAVITAEGKMGERATLVCAMEYSFIGGSMGCVVGEKITRAIERAAAQRLPLVVVSASGGARMMEGTVSLMQMAKISASLARLDEAGLPFLSVLTDPTTGGVTASFAMLGDLNISEPGALIGFAGPRVIEQTIRQKLPAGFQRAEFLLQHGMLDAVVPRLELKAFLVRTLGFLMG